MYKIVRIYKNPYTNSRVIKRGLTLEEAQAHCRDPESSSSRCTKPEKLRITRRMGEWFDGYDDDWRRRK